MAGGHSHVVDVEKEIATRLKAPNLCFLFGAGSSKLVGYPLMSELTRIASDKARRKVHVSKALDALSGVTIEDQLEELLGQLRSPDLSQVSEPVLRESVEHILDVIFEECSKPATLDTHQKFVRAVFGRVNDKRQIHTFTTNYDMLFEWAADREMIHCVNGFYGVQARTFDAAQFDMRPARVVVQTQRRMRIDLCPTFYLYKLHGSVSWVAKDSRVCEIQVAPGNHRCSDQMMVFPTPHKYHETCQTPYVELFTRMSEILNAKQTTLVSLGFGFGDAHVRSAVEKCLKDNTFILIVISKDMLPTMAAFCSCGNAMVVTEQETVIGGRRYSVKSDLWDFSRFVDMFCRS